MVTVSGILPFLIVHRIRTGVFKRSKAEVSTAAAGCGEGASPDVSIAALADWEGSRKGGCPDVSIAALADWEGSRKGSCPDVSIAALAD